MTEAPPVLLQAHSLRVGTTSLKEADLAVLGGSAVVFASDSAGFLKRLASVLAGFSKPWCGRVTAGKASIPATDRQARRIIGFLPAEPCCPDGTTPYGFLKVLAASAGISARQSPGSVQEVLRWCGLGEVRSTPVDKLDREQRLCLAFASAVLQNPSVLVAQCTIPSQLFRQLDDLKAIGKALVLVADSVGSIPPCADRVALCSETDIERLIGRADLARLCAGSVEISAAFCPALPRASLEDIPGIMSLRQTEDGFVFEHPSPSAAVASLSALARANARALTRLDIRSPSIAALLSGEAEEEPGRDQDLFC